MKITKNDGTTKSHEIPHGRRSHEMTNNNWLKIVLAYFIRFQNFERPTGAKLGVGPYDPQDLWTVRKYVRLG